MGLNRRSCRLNTTPSGTTPWVNRPQGENSLRASARWRSGGPVPSRRRPGPETSGSTPSPAGDAARARRVRSWSCAAAIARLRAALIPFDAAALPWAGRLPAVSRHLTRLSKLRKNVSGQRSDANSGPKLLSLRSWAAGLLRSSACVRMSASRACSTAASCIVTSAIRSAPGVFPPSAAAAARGRRRFAAPRAVRDDLAEADCNPGRLGR